MCVCVVTVGIPIRMYRVFSTPTATFSHCGIAANWLCANETLLESEGPLLMSAAWWPPTQPALLSAVKGAATVPKIRVPPRCTKLKCGTSHTHAYGNRCLHFGCNRFSV